MKIYFSGSIYGGRQKLDAYQALMKELKKYGEILNEEVADPKVIEKEEGVRDETIFKNLESKLKIADLIFAELTVASLGVGYELGYGDKLNKKIIGIYDKTITPKISTMIRGNERIKLIPYSDLNEIIDNLEGMIVNMEKKRGFEVAKGFEDKQINLPIRKTKYSAGYDIEAAEDVVIPSFKKGTNPTLVKTGLKAYMQDGEYLMLANRSSNPKKKGLILANSVGIVDKDYYGNPDNDGHIMFAFYNIKDEDVEIKKGEAIGQAIFQQYLTVDKDSAEGERLGGFGSTGK